MGSSGRDGERRPGKPLIPGQRGCRGRPPDRVRSVLSRSSPSWPSRRTRPARRRRCAHADPEQRHADRVEHQADAADDEPEHRHRDGGPGCGGVAVVAAMRAPRAGGPSAGDSLAGRDQPSLGQVGSRPWSMARHRSRLAVVARGRRSPAPLRARRTGCPSRASAGTRRTAAAAATTPSTAATRATQNQPVARGLDVGAATSARSASRPSPGAERRPTHRGHDHADRGDHGPSTATARRTRPRVTSSDAPAGQHAPAPARRRAARGRRRRVDVSVEAGSRRRRRRRARTQARLPATAAQPRRGEPEQHDRRRTCGGRARQPSAAAARRRRSRCGRRCGRPGPPGRP